jgi:hypothetical protein
MPSLKTSVLVWFSCMLVSGRPRLSAFVGLLGVRGEVVWEGDFSFIRADTGLAPELRKTVSYCTLTPII